MNVEQVLNTSKICGSLFGIVHGRRGHLSNKLAAELMAQVVGPGTQYLVTAHLSDDCNRPELVESTARNCLSLSCTLLALVFGTSCAIALRS